MDEDLPSSTLFLSVPFSLLSTLPRLAGMLPISAHQGQPITMGAEIIRLWWDPPPDMIKRLEDIRLRNVAANQHDDS
jgi:hypothetical protein